jgi:serine/threonine protein phosphatase PrpC
MSRGYNTTIGSTVVVMLAHRFQVILLWAGDSRAYCLRKGRLARITQDHTQVEEMVESGLLLREDAENHPSANVITRAVGAMDELYIDIEEHEVESDDIYLLCSDGLNKELSEADIEQILTTSRDIREMGQRLIDTTLERGARDNVTLIITQAVAGMPD